MPRHGGSDYYEERERDYYAPSSAGRGGRVAEYEEIDIRERRRGAAREPDFLREDYARSEAGPLVVREERIEEKEITRGSKGDRRRARDVERDEIVIARGIGERPRERERGVEREEIIYRAKERDRKPIEREIEREEIIYRPRERSPPAIMREREEFIFRPRERSPPRIVKEREEWSFNPRRSDPKFESEEITIKDRRVEREPERPKYESEEITIRDRRVEREPERPKSRAYDREEISIRDRRVEREPERPRSSAYDREEITIRRDEREAPRQRDREYERDEITIRRKERSRSRDRPRPSEANFEREEIIIRRDERERPRERDFKEEELIIRRDERERPRERDYKEEELIIRRDERERPRERDYREEELIIRRDERERPRESNREEIVIRRDRERTPEPEPEPEPMIIAEPPPIRAPTIHQEIITHHRHIDHGFENRAPMTAPAPPRARTPPRPRSPSPAKTAFEEIEIHRRGERNGKAYDDDIIIDTRRRASESRPAPSRRRSLSVGNQSRAYDLDIEDEAEYYRRKTAERAFIGEAYNGATKDWAIIDVPPGTSRVRMDGIGGASQEVTWQRYNGVRRSKFIQDEEVYGGEIEEPSPRGLDRGRRFVAQKPKTEVMWTEITKDLVVKEAIEGMGYDFEETEFFYYVMEYLRYEDVLRLVSISEDLRRERRDRIRQIEYERSHPPERERPQRQIAAAPWDEERIFEREIIYDRPPPPPPPPARREVRERTYVMR